MKLWQLAACAWSAIALTPWAFAALGTAGASNNLKAQCKVSVDVHVRSACRDLGLK